MRFETLVFERYGAFTDRVLELREGAHLHVVLGANEAGKTSALNAIGDLLFGFGHVTSYDFLHNQTTLRVGARVRLADGSPLSFWRRKGKGIKNTLRDADDRPLADDLLAPMLGSVTRAVFFTEFGLTAEALRKGGQELLKAGGRLAETLAASSARLSMLANLRARLDAEAEELFAPSARTKPFNTLFRQHEEAEKHLREAIVTAAALAAAENAVKEAQAKRQSLDEEHDRIGRDLARRERALRTAPKLRRLDSLRAELVGLTDLPDVDAETLASWRDAHDEATSVEKELADQRLDEAEGAVAIAALMVDEPLLEIGGKIDALREKLGAVRKAEDDLPRRGESARIARAALAEAASRLGLASVE
ncbi:MAG TPA: AAA family ATPase, partial [Methylocystis sp.]